MKPYAMMSIEELEEQLYLLNARKDRSSNDEEIEELDEKINEIEDMIEQSMNLYNY